MKYLFLVITFSISFLYLEGKEGDSRNTSTRKSYEFEEVTNIPVTSVKNQSQTGTCWSFSMLSFFESEMLRMGKPEVDLSEMFIVWHTYLEKAKKDIRLHGNLNFGEGGAFHDVTNMISEYGIVPESVYNGLINGNKNHSHSEMDKALKNFVDEVIKNGENKLDGSWKNEFESNLNNYLGQIPDSFEYNGICYTPKTFSTDVLGLNMENYVELTSYTHHPFYSKFILEVPDNWSWDEIYNVPLDEMQEIIDSSLYKGYTVAWGADVSEEGFATNKVGIAVLPLEPNRQTMTVEVDSPENFSEKEWKKELYKFKTIIPEMSVTQEMRQNAFDNYETTDDHGMHIVGIAKNQDGSTFYKVKNSWGKYNCYNGFFYTSRPYMAYKTMSIMVNKESIPRHIREKLKL